MVLSLKKDIWMAVPIWILIIVFLRMLYEVIAQVSIIGIVVAVIIISSILDIKSKMNY